MTFLRQLVIGVYLDGEVLARVDELNEEREGISELLIDAFAYKQPFVFIDELCEVESEVYIPDDASLDSNGLVTGYCTDLPRLTDIRLRGVNALKGGNLITTPDGGLQVRLKFIRLHVAFGKWLARTIPLRLIVSATITSALRSECTALALVPRKRGASLPKEG